MKLINFSIRGVLIGLIYGGRALAADPANGYSLGDLEKIQEETLFNQAKLENARARSELDKYLQANQPPVMAGISDGQHLPAAENPPVADNMAGTRLAVPVKSEQQPGLPLVIQIWGNRQQLNARLQIPGGQPLTVTKNTLLPDGQYRVIAITARQVMIGRAGEAPKLLAFSGGNND
ncbi:MULTISPECIES: type IV pilus biogenesis protein PilP [Tatumella]|uniref:Type IV pilus biogenesis protein PilP n=1 Tax=Tatumella punctata TaxID=399969 RepID=A0ABW1VLF8_9GAMM|nr:MULTISPECIES: type IV pilus biogenesis protein PilP [unclassified Tatumella]MBS0877075.1 type IV pilus biogenesis protein PilP [Tatumella sp. JGM82]MBS0890657.1 type IV pilus biogenesis protein PilP [Tatumella sp. JGM94]MBS0893329.1 type IV pilus biogenesis protein PilP [Tatumella sp. JGM130]MBS0901378.1 type IV pilus biogenesis protein PilP [Tatumella sp. JGM100]